MRDDQVHKKAASLAQMAIEKLRELGESRDLTQAESTMLAAVTTEDYAYCGPSDADDDERNNPEHADLWPKTRDINAKLIRWLCSDRRTRKLIDPRGIQVHGAKITGGLDLRDLVVPFPFSLVNCFIPGEV